MSRFKGMFALVLACLAHAAFAQQADQLAAARVLGPRWKQISRVAGKVFTGSVVSVASETATKKHPFSNLEIKLRVDHGIAGVRTGELLTIHEWVGASSINRQMRSGQRALILLYPSSRLGLTSPVGGAAGQIALDASGKNVIVPTPSADDFRNSRVTRPSRAALAPQIVSVAQLERAIRSARRN